MNPADVAAVQKAIEDLPYRWLGEHVHDDGSDRHDTLREFFENTWQGSHADELFREVAQAAVVALRAQAPASDVVDAMERLRIMAAQNLRVEMGSDEDREGADYEGAYDWFCDESRQIYAALSALAQPVQAPAPASGEPVAITEAEGKSLHSALIASMDSFTPPAQAPLPDDVAALVERLEAGVPYLPRYDVRDVDATNTTMEDAAELIPSLWREVERGKKHRNDLADIITDQQTTIGALREQLTLMTKSQRNPS